MSATDRPALADARPGEVFRDRDGDVWVRTGRGFVAVVVHGPNAGYVATQTPEKMKGNAGGSCAPYVRLVPEEP